MMHRKTLLAIMLALVLALAFTGTAAAQDPTPEGGEEETTTTVSGRVIAVDLEAGTVTLLTEEGEEITLSLAEADYEHPVVALLAAYFGGGSLDEYADALDALEVELPDEQGDPVAGTVVSVTEMTDAEGNPYWEVVIEDEDGNQATVTITDEELAADLLAALETLDTSFEVAEDGETIATSDDIGDAIEAYHEEGIGLGVLVKLYAIAEESSLACETAEDGEPVAEPEQPAEGETPAEGEEETCGVTVEELIEQFKGGGGMGQLFQEYGKPALLGVGHIRQALNEKGGGVGLTAQEGEEDAGDTPSGAPGTRGICNAREHGGNANARGQNVECP
ncbi:MAG: hypothetical protein Kow00124_24070 [Anaerolineae bacterium]